MKKAVFASLIIFSLFTRCTSTVKMALTGPEWQQNKQEYAVEGRNKTFKKQVLKFGNYETVELKRSWTKGTSATSGFGMGGTIYEPNYLYKFDHIDKKQTYRFKLKDAQNNISETTCATKVKAKDFTLGNNQNSAFNILLDVFSVGIESENNFYARIITDPNQPAWELLLDNQAAQRSKQYAGSLMQTAGDYYTIVPVSKLMGKNGPVEFPFAAGAVGFEFRNEAGEAVAAVSLIDKGMVYLRDIPADRQFVLANACAAILLQQADVL